MATNPLKTVIVQANANNKNWRTVNVVAGTAPAGKKQHLQVTAAQNTLRQFPTYQPSGGTIPGLPTIWIPGYTGPA
jgi:hypothetical protein